MGVTTGVRIDAGADAPHHDVVVVGAGLGGLATAAALTLAGRRVLVLEQHHVVGGRSQSFRRGPEEAPHEFDVAVPLLGECEPGGRVRTSLTALGVDDRVEWRRLDPEVTSTVTLPDLEVQVPVGWEAYEQRLAETFGDQAEAVRRCVRVLRDVARELRELEETQRPGLRGLLDLATRPTLLRWGHRPLGALLDACGLDPRARAVVAAETGNAATAPARVLVGVHAGLLDHQLTSGTWTPHGGARALPAALTEVVRAHGGEVRTGVHVDRVLVEGGRAVGVTLVDGTEVRADVVVSNADPRRTYLGLVGREHLPARLLRRAEAMVPALPLVTVHLALDGGLPDLPRTARWVLPDPDLDAAFAAAEEGRLVGPVPVRMVPGGATSGGSTLELTTVAPAVPSAWGLRAGGPSAGERYSDAEAYLVAKSRWADAVLTTAETVLPGLRRHVVHQEVSTPVTHEHHTLAWAGTTHGLERSRRQVGRTGLGPRTPLPGLFLTGAGSTYVPGIAATLEGGRRTAAAVLSG